MIKNLVFSFLTIFSFYLPSQTVLTSYGFANVTNSTGTVDPSPTPSITGLTCGSFSANGVSANPNASGRFSFTGWPTGSSNAVDSYTAFTGVLTPTAYYEVSISPLTTYTLNLSAITFFVRRSGTGIRNYAVRSNTDNYAANLPASTGTNSNLSVISPNTFFWNFDGASTSSDQKGSTISLSDASFTNCINPLTFRFYAWNAEASGGTFSIDSVVFYGTAKNSITPPPPIDVALLSYSDKKDQFQVYPNPTKDGIIFIDTKINISKIELIDLVGAVLISEPIFNNEATAKLNTSCIQRGTYFLKIYSENTSLVKKITLTD